MKVSLSQKKLNEVERQAKKFVLAISTDENEMEVDPLPAAEPVPILAEPKEEEVLPIPVASIPEAKIIISESIEVSEKSKLDIDNDKNLAREGSRKSTMVIVEKSPTLDPDKERLEMQRLLRKQKEMVEAEQKAEKETQEAKTKAKRKSQLAMPKAEKKVQAAESSIELKVLEQLAKDMNLLHCKACLIEFETIVELNRHARTVHNAKFGHITCCEQKFISNNIRQHMRYHQDSSAFTCQACADVFMSPRLLLYHERTVHRMRCNFQCPDCGMKFASTKALLSHSLTHAPDPARKEELKRHVCHQCDKSKHPIMYLLSFRALALFVVINQI